MGRERKNCGCGCGSDNHDLIDPSNNSRRRAIFQMDITSLLIALSEDDDARRATLILDAQLCRCFNAVKEVCLGVISIGT